MEIFFSFFLFPIFHSSSAREILRTQKELEKYFSYCTLHRAITSTYSPDETHVMHRAIPSTKHLICTNNLLNHLKVSEIYKIARARRYVCVCVRASGFVYVCARASQEKKGNEEIQQILMFN